MKCSLCEGIALRQVGSRGFCKTHTPEAFAAAYAENRLVEAEASTLDSDEILRRKFARAEGNGWEARP